MNRHLAGQGAETTDARAEARASGSEEELAAKTQPCWAAGVAVMAGADGLLVGRLPGRSLGAG